MLSRTADHLFWMARYMERAENTARMLDVTLKTLLLPQSGDSEQRSLRAVLDISELGPAFTHRYGDPTRDTLLHFMTVDPDNPSSIYCSLQGARENARAVRGALTTEAWETVNHTWLGFGGLCDENLLRTDANALFEWVKMRSHLSRGVTIGTALVDEAFYFTRLGTFLERADNTARILDARFAAPGADPHTDLNDFYYWSSIVSSVSGLEIYRKVYRDVVTAERVIELLMLNPQMPRSLLYSLNGVCNNLECLQSDWSRDCERYAGKLPAELMYADIGAILEYDLHRWLNDFLCRIGTLGVKVGQTFLLQATE